MRLELISTTPITDKMYCRSFINLRTMLNDTTLTFTNIFNL